MTSEVVQVVAAAIVHRGRVLAARRTGPADVAGGWELPGGKVDPQEPADAALAREIREELGCTIKVLRRLDGRVAIKPGYELTAYLVELVAGEPIPHEHDAARWLAPEELDQVAWLPADLPFLAELGNILLDGQVLPGGNVGGAVRIGATVRRATGPWTPAVHALLEHLRKVGVEGVPQVLGADARGREVLTYLPGRVAGDGVEQTSDEVLADAMRFLRRFHDVVVDFRHAGPWRNDNEAPGKPVMWCHHDFAPYNVALSSSATGDRVVGVFDWDMAGPGTRLQDLAFAAWNWVPLHQPLLPVDRAAQRLCLLATSYGSDVSAVDILDGVVPRIDDSVRKIAAGQAAGDEGMLTLGQVGEPARTSASLGDLQLRLPVLRAQVAELVAGVECPEGVGPDK